MAERNSLSWSAGLSWQIMKPFGIFNLTQLFMWGTRLRDLVYLTCRESVRLICSVTLIISKHVFTPFVLSNPIFSCSTKDWDQIWRCTDGWWCCCFWLWRLLQMPLHYFLPTVRLPSCASLISASGPHSVSAIWIWNALHAVLNYYPS